MQFISLTRLRIRSVRFLPGFAVLALRSGRQVRAAAGFLGGSLLADRQWTFWTMTAWEDQQAMRAYMTTGDHRSAMPSLLESCDEASVAHWDQPQPDLPTWLDADERMRREGRPSKVRFPSSDHAGMTFPRPRVAAASPLRPTPR